MAYGNAFEGNAARDIYSADDGIEEKGVDYTAWGIETPAQKPQLKVVKSRLETPDLLHGEAANDDFEKSGDPHAHLRQLTFVRDQINALDRKDQTGEITTQERRQLRDLKFQIIDIEEAVIGEERLDQHLIEGADEMEGIHLIEETFRLEEQAKALETRLKTNQPIEREITMFQITKDYLGQPHVEIDRKTYMSFVGSKFGTRSPLMSKLLTELRRGNGDFGNLTRSVGDLVRYGAMYMSQGAGYQSAFAHLARVHDIRPSAATEAKKVTGTLGGISPFMGQNSRQIEKAATNYVPEHSLVRPVSRDPKTITAAQKAAAPHSSVKPGEAGYAKDETKNPTKPGIFERANDWVQGKAITTREYINNKVTGLLEDGKNTINNLMETVAPAIETAQTSAAQVRSSISDKVKGLFGWAKNKVKSLFT